MLETARLLKELHQLGVYHGGISPESVLYSELPIRHVKLAEFQHSGEEGPSFSHDFTFRPSAAP